MRILADDIPGKLSVYEWLVDQTSSVEGLVLAGDPFDADFEDQQRLRATEIVKILRRPQATVLYIMGNVDKMALDQEEELIRPLHGCRIEIGDYNFVGYQYTPPFVGESFVNEDAEIRCDLVSLEPLVDERTMLVMHTPAFENLDRCDSGNAGSRGLSNANLFWRTFMGISTTDLALMNIYAT